MPKLLRWRAATWPDSPAFFRKHDGAWQPTSWGTVRDQVAALATGLADLGLKRGDRVAIQAENSPEWIYADMAANAAGGIVVGAYPSSSAVELRQLLQDSGASILFSENEETVAKVLPMLGDCPSVVTIVVMNPGSTPAGQKILTLADVMARGRTAAPDRFDTLVDDTRATDVACIIYTSGTTGAPKGAMLTHRAAIAGAVTTAVSLGMDASDVTIAYLPLCHLAERNLTLYVLPLIGHVVYFASSLKALPEETREVSPTFFGAVPRIAQKMQAQIEQDVAARGPLAQANYRLWLSIGRRIARRRIANGYRLAGFDRVLFRLGSRLLYDRIRDRLGLRRVRHCIIGTAPVPPALLEYFHVIGIPFRQSYGQTEAGGITHLSCLDRLRFDAIGPGAPGYEFRLEPATGEVLVRGGGVFAGYWNRPDATAVTLTDGWLHTGDLGVLTDDGQLRLIGRSKDIIITAGGKNIAPAAIEGMLRASPHIKEAVLVGEGRHYITALIGIEYDSVARWAKARGLTFSNHADLVARPEVVALIGDWIDGVNHDLARVEAIKKFRLLGRELDIAHGELTVTRKVKREAVVRQFAPLVAEMYA